MPIFHIHLFNDDNVIAARQIEIGGRFAQIATEIATYIEVNPSKIYRGNAPRFNDWKKAKLHHIYVKIPGYPEIVAVATRNDNVSWRAKDKGHLSKAAANHIESTVFPVGTSFSEIIGMRSEAHTSELQSLMRLSYAVI